MLFLERPGRKGIVREEEAGLKKSNPTNLNV